MRILLLHQHYKTPATGGAIRSWHLARALTSAGHKVVVITGSQHRDLTISNADGFAVHHLPVSYRNDFGFLRRVWSFYRFARMAFHGASSLSPFDLCYAISTPLTTGWTAIRLKKKLGVPFIFEVGDLWPDAPIALGFIRNPLLKRWLYKLELSIYREAEKIVALSPPIAAAVQKKVPGKPVVVIPNFADTDYFNPSAKPSDLVWQYGADAKFVITYAGALGWANGLESLVRCAEACQSAKLPVLFLMVGEGAQVKALRELCSRRQIRNVQILTFRNRDGVREIMSITDAVFVSFRSESILETGSPHKFFDGLAAGKLIILNFGGWLQELVQEAQCGFVTSCPIDFPAQIATYATDNALLHKAQANARVLAQSFTSSRLIAPLLQYVAGNK